MRNLIVLSLVSFFQDLSSETIFPILTYMVGSFGVQYFGIMEAIAELTSNLLKLVSGNIYDRFSKAKPLIFVGYFLSTMAKGVYIFANLPILFILGRFGDRIGKGIRTSPRDALLSLSVPKDKQGIAFGIHRFSDTLGAVFGPLLLLFLISRFSERYIIAIALIPAVIAVLLITLAKEVGKAKTPKFTIRFVLPLKLSLFLVFLSMGNISIGFFLLKGGDIHILPINYFVFNVIYAVMSLVAGYFYDKVGFKVLMLLGLAFLILSDIAVIKGLPLLLSVSLFGVFYGIYDTIPKAYVGKVMGENLKGSAFGSYYILSGISLFVGNILAGFLFGLYGNVGAFVLSAMFGIFATITLIFL